MCKEEEINDWTQHFLARKTGGYNTAKTFFGKLLGPAITEALPGKKLLWPHAVLTRRFHPKECSQSRVAKPCGALCHPLGDEANNV